MRPEAAEERDLVEGLRRGDEDAFAALVRRHNPSMLRLAVVYVGDRAVAEEVVQDTWQALVEGLAPGDNWKPPWAATRRDHLASRRPSGS